MSDISNEQLSLKNNRIGQLSLKNNIIILMQIKYIKLVNWTYLLVYRDF